MALRNSTPARSGTGHVARDWQPRAAADRFAGSKRLLGAFEADRAAWEGGRPAFASGTTETDARGSVAAIAETARTALRAAAAVRSNKDLHPERRAERVREIAAQAREDISAAAERARAHITVAGAEHSVAALGSVSKSDQLSARSDMRMILDSIPADRVTLALADLAKRDDAVGYLAASQVGSDYLTSRGVPERLHAEAVRDARSNALAAARESADPARRSAAEAAAHFGAAAGLPDYAGPLARAVSTEILAAGNSDS